jgi:hypothetical protein
VFIVVVKAILAVVVSVDTVGLGDSDTVDEEKVSKELVVLDSRVGIVEAELCDDEIAVDGLDMLIEVEVDSDDVELRVDVSDVSSELVIET